MSPTGGELRRNPVSGKLALVAPGRAARPSDLEEGGGQPPCPFCRGNEALTPPEVDAVRPGGGEPDSPGWTVRAVPNKYPALAGLHEVILHSPEHDTELDQLGDEGLAEALGMWRRRIDALLKGGAAAATLIVNRGEGSGASLEHPHAQLFGTPVVPPLLLDELLEFERHRNRYGTCVLCEEIETAGERLVEDDDVAAWTPAASRFAGELWLAPAAHEPDVRDTDLTAFARTLRRALTAVVTATSGAPLNLWIHTAPADLRGPYHWHVEIAPRLAVVAGFERASDIGLVGRDPIEMAAAYRGALPRD